MRKLIVAALCLLISGTAYAQLVTLSFPDVPKESKYYTAIDHFYKRGIVKGYTDGTFRPEQPANRAEALKIILLSSNITVEQLFAGEDVFPDVKAEDWYYSYIKRATELDIVQGYNDGYFRPTQNQNVAETLKIILLTNGVTVNDVDENFSVYPDVKGDVWFAPFAQYAKEKYIIEPQNDGNLNAGRSITRGELVELMYRMEIVLQNEGKPFDISTNWPTVSYPQYAFKAKLPFDWKIVNNEDQVVFWHPDTVNYQSTYEIPYPFSGEVKFHLDQNDAELSKDQYIANIEMVYKSDFGTYQRNTLNIGGYETLNLNVSPVHDDYYIFFPNKKVLQVYSSFGWSDLTDHLQLEIDKIIENIDYINPSTTSSLGSSDVLTTARNQILVEGLGQATLDLFSDLVNIETDTIGVGTGPVDYFYSEAFNVTLKYERSSDTILDIQNGQTSAF